MSRAAYLPVLLLLSGGLAACSDGGGDDAPPTPTGTSVTVLTAIPAPTQTPTATSPTQTRTAEPSPTATVTPTVDAAAIGAAGEAAFFDTLNGIQDRQDEAISLLGDAIAANPADGRSHFLLGMMHLFRASTRLTDYDAATQFVLDEVEVAQTFLDQAVPLSPQDKRIPGFRGATTFLNGLIRKDPARRDLGLRQLRDAVPLYPEFNNFSFLGSVAPAVPATDPLFLEALELARGAISGGCSPFTQPEICGNAGKAPHNIQGAMVLLGDMFTKSGDANQAKVYYGLALNFPGADTWRFRSLAEDRIANAAERAALWADADPINDPRFVGNGPEACAYCHFK